MTRIRLGTRGSKLALWQTNWVTDRLREAHPDVEIEQVVIKTHGDVVTDEQFGEDWPVGAFVSAIERALMEERVDLAVHSYKDLQTAVTTGLTVAAVPAREAVNDVLLTRKPVDIDNLPRGFRVGTGSPRRSAQFRRLGGVEIAPIRGNVETRVAKIEADDLGGVVLAAAGLKRLGITYAHMTDLPTDRFVPSPAQGALALQTREGSDVAALLEVLDHPESHRAVLAERSFLKRVNAGCHVPIGALANVSGNIVSLHGQLFDQNGEHMAEETMSGDDPVTLGVRMADTLLERLQP
ncbi:MAG: hydroxymethylbilane synthase [Phycisphaerae bacterium]|jgi:hydroxymethylbilane synthase